MTSLSAFQIITLILLLVALVLATTPAWSFVYAACAGTHDFIRHIIRYRATRNLQPCAGQTWTDGTSDTYQITKTYGPDGSGGVVIRQPYDYQTWTISKARWDHFRHSQLLIPLNPNENTVEDNDQS